MISASSTAWLARLGLPKWNVYTDASYWPGIFVFLSAWKHVGYGSIVYLAAIMGISAEIYESAALDGANEWQKIRYITLPGIMPTFIVLLILAIGNIFRGNFDMFYQLVGTNGPALQFHRRNRHLCLPLAADQLRIRNVLRNRSVSVRALLGYADCHQRSHSPDQSGKRAVLTMEIALH